MEAIKVLKRLHYSDWRRRSTAPDYTYPRPIYNPRTANGLTRCIVDFINFLGGQAERISSEGRIIDNRKTITDVAGRVKTIGSVQRAYSTTTNGTADISATIKGRSVKIEVKIGNDRQSEAQKAYQEAIEKAGGIYVIAKDFEAFYQWFLRSFGIKEVKNG